jgi:transcription antitermination factor NusG
MDVSAGSEFREAGHLETGDRTPSRPEELQDRRWYAIRVRSNFEKAVASALEGKGFEGFLPLYRTSRRWSDRSKGLDLPLFPNYLFCRFDLRERVLPILTIPGVITIVGTGKVPVPLMDEEIATIRMVILSGVAALPWPRLVAGDKVLIERGPLAGLEGVALNAAKKHRLVVSVPLLQRSIAVEIDRDWIRPIATSKPAA